MGFHSSLIRLRHIVLCIVLSVSAVSPAQSAAVPSMVKFSGVLAGSSQGIVTAVFALYQDQSGGAPLWQETQSVMLDSSGRYTVLLGARSQAGIPAAIFATNEARWLGVSVQGEPEQPRVLLVSVPYAMKAFDAETLGGLPASAYLQRSEIFTTTKSGALVNAEAIDAAARMSAPGISIQGTVSKYQLPMFADTTGDLTGSIVHQSGANLGIGTSSPQNVLDVWGADGGASLQVMAPGIPPSAGNGGVAQFTFAMQTSDGKTTIAPWSYGSEADYENGTLVPDTYLYDNNTNVYNYAVDAQDNMFLGGGGWGNNPALFLGANGKVGIGTTAPNSLLTVHGPVQSTAGGFIFPNGTTQSSAVTSGNFVDLSSTQTIGGSKTFTSTINGNIAGNVNGNATTATTASNANLLGGFPSSAFQPAGSYATTTGSNIFTGIQTITNGSLYLPATVNSGTGAIIIGTTPFAHSFGSYNTFIGSSAGNFTMTGNSNTAIGFQTLSKATSGGSNTAGGYQALTANTSGSGNTALGYIALTTNDQGVNNTAIGNWALASNQGNVNTAIGNMALDVNSSGANNTALGNFAGGASGGSGTGNTVGTNNTFLGAYSGAGSAQNLNYATAIGAGSLVSESNALVLGGTGGYAVNVGIGTATPAYTLDVHGSGNFTGAVNFAQPVTFPSNQTLNLSTAAFMGSNTSQILSATQSGTGNAIFGANSGNGIGVSGSSTGGSGIYGDGGNYGVFGHTSSGTGVFGTSSSGTGVYGSNSGNGAVGQLGTSIGGNAVGAYGSSGAYGVYGLSTATGGNGVYGRADTGDGVFGTGATGVWGVGSNYGLYGTSSSGDGVSGNSAGGVGVYGFSSGSTGIGVYGNAPSGIAIDGVVSSSTAVAVQGTSSNSYGRLGLGSGVGVLGSGNGTGVSGSGTNYGVFGNATGDNGTGVYGQSGMYGVIGSTTSSTGAAVYAFNTGNGAAGELGTSINGVNIGVYGSSGDESSGVGVVGTGPTYGVYSSGNLGASGTKPAVVALPDNRVVELYAMESPELWFEDFGSGKLHDGVAEITIEPTYALSVNTGSGYHVFLTPNGDCEGLYVTQKTATGFQVRELRGGKSNVEFEYRIVSKRRGYEGTRMDQLDADAETVQSIREHGHPSGVRRKLVLHKPMEPVAVSARVQPELPKIGAPGALKVEAPQPAPLLTSKPVKKTVPSTPKQPQK